MRATVKDVAQHAGVSPKTVSNVINGGIFVRPETRARVEKALEELAYVPNLSARALRNGRSGVIALALPDLATAYSAELAHNFVEVAHEQGWAVQIEETGTQTTREWNLLSRARSHLIDGLVLNPVNLAESAIADSGPLPPVVLIGEVEQDRVDQVWVDSVAAARDMTAHLLSLGHTRIAVVGSPDTVTRSTARLRLEGYHQALREASIAADPELEVRWDGWSPDGGAEAVRGYLATHDLPDAFFCFTDSLAFGALSALWSLGYTVPRDTVVAGFDDVADGRHSIPPLTTVSFDKRAFAETALRMLVERMNAPDAPVRRATIEHTILVRASTGDSPTSTGG